MASTANRKNGSVSRASEFVSRVKESLSEMLISHQGREYSYKKYLEVVASDRSGDEACFVDTRFTNNLLRLLGFTDNEQEYNATKVRMRPDYIANVRWTDEQGNTKLFPCFPIEDKNSATRDLLSHVRQAARYAQAHGTPRALLTNGQKVLGLSFERGYDNHEVIVDIDLLEYLKQSDGEIEQDEMFPLDLEMELKALYLRFAKENFSSTESFIRQIGLPLDEWKLQARSVEDARDEFIDELSALVDELQVDASAQIRRHLRKAEEFRSRAASSFSAASLASSGARRASFQQKRLKLAITTSGSVADYLRTLNKQPTSDAASDFELELTEVATSPNTTLGDEWLAEAFERYSGIAPKKTPGPIRQELRAFVESCKQSYRWEMEIWPTYEKHVQAADKFNQWWALVGETLELDSIEKAVEEFALQAAYIMLIRLLLVRICEDKGVFLKRTLSDGGFKEMHDALRRYLEFSKASGFEELLSIAFKNAQRVYAHFYGGRQLFDWYATDDQRMIRIVYQLNRFDFSDVKEDILGTVYERYAKVHGAENEGRYYTTPPVSRYMCDLAGFDDPSNIIGKKFIDPACGSGTFLVAGARSIIQGYTTSSLNMKPREIIEQVVRNVWGFDINPFACYLSETNLLIQLLDLIKQAYRDDDFQGITSFHIYQTDSLMTTGLSPALASGEEGFEEDFTVPEAVKTQAQISEELDFRDGFDIVITNPPYGSFHPFLSASFASATENNNLYAAFFDLCTSLCSIPGKVVMIIPTTWLSQPMYKRLRERFFSTLKPLNITALPKDVFERAYVDCVVYSAEKTIDAENSAGLLPTADVQVTALPKRFDINELNISVPREVINSGMWYDEPDLQIMLDRNVLDLRAYFRASTFPKLDSSWDIQRGTLPPGEELASLPRGKQRQDYMKYLFTGKDHNIHRYRVDKTAMGLARIDALREMPRVRFFETVPRVLLRRLVSRQWRLQAAVEDVDAYGNKKDIYSLIPKTDNASSEILCAYLNSRLPAYLIVKSSQAAQKDDMTQLIYRDILALPYPQLSSSEQNLVLDNYARVRDGEAKSWALHSSGVKHKYLPGLRDKAALGIELDVQASIDRVPRLDWASAVSRGLFRLNGDLEARCTGVLRDDNFIYLRGGKGRPELWIEAASEPISKFLLWYCSQEIEKLKANPLRSLLSTLVVPREEDLIRQVLAARDIRTAEIEVEFEQLWQADDELDQIFLEVFGVPESLRQAVMTFPSDI